MKKTDNQVLVIFGASGDLTQRKLIPAVFNLYIRGFLPECYAILGVSRTEFSDDEYRKKVLLDNKYINTAQSVSEEQRQSFAQKVFYQPLDSDENQNYDYDILKKRLSSLQADVNLSDN